MLSDGRHSYIHNYENNASMLSRVIFYLKSVHFLFLFSIYDLNLRGHSKISRFEWVVCTGARLVPGSDFVLGLRVSVEGC